MTTAIESPRHEAAACTEQARVHDQINEWREQRATKQQALGHRAAARGRSDAVRCATIQSDAGRDANPR